MPRYKVLGKFVTYWSSDVEADNKLAAQAKVDADEAVIKYEPDYDSSEILLIDEITETDK